MKKLSPKGNIDNFGKLRKLIVLCFSFLFIFITFFLFRWQLVEVEKIQDLASERYQSKSLSSIRGDILAKNGETLAYSEPRWDVFAYLGDMREAEASTETRGVLQTREEFISKVSTVLGSSEQEVRLRLELLSCPLWSRVVDKIDDEEKINELKQSYIYSPGNFKEQVGEILNINSSQVAFDLNSCPVWVKLASKINYKTKENLDNMPRASFLKKIQAQFDVSESLIKCILRETKEVDCNEYSDSIPEETLTRVRKYIAQNRTTAFLVGVNYEFTSQRIYPENELAAHVIGFLGRDLNSNDIGRGGLEQKYNGVLEPQEGFIAGETDSQGNLIAISDSVSIRAKRGSTIKTTIDKTIQEIIEKKIKEGVEQYEAVSGSIVIMDPKIGSIIAVANYPTYNPNEYYNVEDVGDFTNRAVSIPYEIGSVMKVITMSAAVEELNVKGDEIVVNGHNGCIEIKASEDEYDVRTLCTFDKMPQGPLTATQAFVNSDNIAFIELGKNLGKERLYQYLSDFGVGKSTVIDLSGESIGYLPTLDNPYAWHPVDMGVFSYGHGFEVNLIQAVKAVGALPNNGWMMQPYVVSEIIDSEGVVKKFDPVPIKKVVSDETTESITVMMEELFKSNANWGFKHLLNYPVAVKSGTALIPYKDRAGYSSDVNATYIGYDSSEDARFIMAVRLESPQSVQKLSFYSARPLWLSTFDEIKDHIGIKPRE